VYRRTTEFIETGADPQALAALETNLRQVETVSLSGLYLPSGLLSSDYTQVQLFLKLPLTSRLALCEL
jgi:hypothetical protein